MVSVSSCSGNIGIGSQNPFCQLVFRKSGLEPLPSCRDPVLYRIVGLERLQHIAEHSLPLFNSSNTLGVR
ncbi:hypothetical protein CEXT_762121 [Caerostris extrusa]|uniref:Uncharacterized protein n=1 Tax=Caerostris extrusa TaxID=172846 RepID=A0AAV4S3C1_CAEEX|nr:hypothetical protein CEXT_762121 [Caerostris extrusa]